MNELDEAIGPFAPVDDPTTNFARKCLHGKDRRVSLEDGGWRCPCGHEVTGEKVRAGRRTRARGNAKERASAKRNGTTRSGQFGGIDDFRTGMFAFQNKSFVTARFPGWISVQLDAVRLAWPDKEPVLHIEESPGPGRRPRRLYVVDETTWLRLHGPTP